MPRTVQFAAHAVSRFPLFRGRRWFDPRPSRLDLNSLPDHLKRDLGFMGGHASPVRDLLRD